MKILLLQRYMFWHFLKSVAVLAVIALALAFIVDFVEVADRYADRESVTTAILVGITGNRILQLVSDIIPFVILLAAVMHFSSLNRRLELVVARAGGMSVWQFVAPAIAGAFLVGVVTILLIGPLTTYSTEWIALATGQKSTTLGERRSLWLRERTDAGTRVIGGTVEGSAPDAIYEVTVLDIGKDGAVKRRIDADRAVIADNKMVLDGVVERPIGGRMVVRETIDFPTDVTPARLKPREIDPRRLALTDIPAAESDAEARGASVAPLRTRMHQLLAKPITLIVMVIFAATVAVKFERTGPVLRLIAGGVAAGFLLYVVSVLSEGFGSAGLIAPAIAVWVPILVAGLMGTAFLIQREDG
ncbi:LptF/LptG family permease [Notoacmeibacter sp. MSK16QG-6]|uniref:LptF/LptG family permease n=1 Tax=Notoacmeibacter sp. MSK16QG-6 TaxID=2957982 RepID=UPI0020A18C19|nr:LptF/LptG family permease [Notoacmeibacter sp. MSK16QG-6]MCP1197977.1 LptF/LptG family permease [Notoacmeibacter sp. MSK16QG-6]